MAYEKDEGHILSQDMEPSLKEVQQTEEPESFLVSVKVCEPTETRELPSKRIATRTVSILGTAASKILAADPRRKTATIIGRTSDIMLGSTQAQAQLNGAWLPGVVPFVISSVGEVWAMGDGASTDVSVIEEYWA